MTQSPSPASMAPLPAKGRGAESTLRLTSVDFLRGLIMALLLMESTGMYELLSEAAEHTWLQPLVLQFFHHPWNGLRFWDLIQPSFMFIAGVSLAASLQRQEKSGVPWGSRFKKVLKRSAILFFLGILNYAVRPAGLSFELWNVLTQLSFTTLVAFLIFNWSAGNQIALSVGLLLLTELLYRFSDIPGFEHAFVDQHNFGNFADLLLMGKINPGGWVAINCIPTACHTVWGALAGKLVLSDKPAREKIRALIVAGVSILVLGYLLDLKFTPIIKRIATTSFTLVSGGWVLLALALCYWWIDVQHHTKKIFFFRVIGMNSLFIYLFFEIVGARWFNGYIMAIVSGLLTFTTLPHLVVGIVSASVIFILEWSMCLFLYRRNVFIKI